jgi:hypothetical protein
MKRILILVLVSILLTFLLGLLGGFLGGACHCMTPITVLFPYGTIVVMRTPWETFGLLLAALQFPLYSLVLTSVRGRRRQFLLLAALLVIHSGAVLLGLTVYR